MFEARERFKGFESLYVLPLLVKDEVMGTFTVAVQRAGAFPADRREMLGVIANQVAISLQNGRMVEALEEKATTDGLTGLTNQSGVKRQRRWRIATDGLPHAEQTYSNRFCGRGCQETPSLIAW